MFEEPEELSSLSLSVFMNAISEVSCRSLSEP